MTDNSIMDSDLSTKFTSSLSQFLKSFTNRHFPFSNGVLFIGHIHLDIDAYESVDYVLNESVERVGNDAVNITSRSFQAFSLGQIYGGGSGIVGAKNVSQQDPGRNQFHNVIVNTAKSEIHHHNHINLPSEDFQQHNHQGNALEGEATAAGGQPAWEAAAKDIVAADENTEFDHDSISHNDEGMSELICHFDHSHQKEDEQQQCSNAVREDPEVFEDNDESFEEPSSGIVAVKQEYFSARLYESPQGNDQKK